MLSKLVSFRALSQHLGRCYDYEFEDLYSNLVHAEIVAPEPNRGRRRFGRRRSEFVAAPLRQKLDLLFLSCVGIWDLQFVDAIDDWRSASHIVVCWIREHFACTEIPPKLLRALQRCDLVILNFEGSVEAMRRHLPTVDVIYMPLGIDTLAFAPYPVKPTRCIDINWVGRSQPDVHRALFAMAERENLFYSFNSIFGDRVTSYVEHRARFRAAVKRTRFFVVHPAKFNEPLVTGGQEEVGYRYYEGSIAGATLVGRKPKGVACPFPVVELPFEASAFADALLQLQRDGDDECTRRATVAHGLRNHDWVYQIAAILAHVGLQDDCIERRLPDRSIQLHTLADAIESRTGVM